MSFYSFFLSFSSEPCIVLVFDAVFFMIPICFLHVSVSSLHVLTFLRGDAFLFFMFDPTISYVWYTFFFTNCVYSLHVYVCFLLKLMCFFLSSLSLLSPPLPRACYTLMLPTVCSLYPRRGEQGHWECKGGTKTVGKDTLVEEGRGITQGRSPSERA